LDDETSEEAEEREEWGGIEPAKDIIEEESYGGTKPKKPPTGEELRTIKDATELFRSSSFKLQVLFLFFF
jgi:U3 small nucleolar RNA-associated protein 22